MKHFPQHYEKGDLVFFLHIPKTAGTSLTNALTAAFPEENTITPAQINNARKQDPLVFTEADLLCGHYTHTVYSRRLLKQPGIVLTFLRNPVEHFISTFFHLQFDPTFGYTIRLTGDKPAAEEFHEAIKDATLEEFLAHPMSHLFTNFQTRYLVNGLSSDYKHLSDELLLPIAQKMLLDLPFFGITERFDDSMALLDSVLDLPAPLQTIEDNRSRNKPSDFVVPEELQREIHHRTAADQLLYQIAVLAFSARYDAFTLAHQAHSNPDKARVSG